MDCSLPGFSIHGIFQARVLEWGAIAFSGKRVEDKAKTVGGGAEEPRQQIEKSHTKKKRVEINATRSIISLNVNCRGLRTSWKRISRHEAE